MSNPHVERMKEEHKELCVKVNALNAFIHSNAVFKTLCNLEQARMIKQSGFMESYVEILESRIWVAN
jgi:hypothetical protein